MPFRRILCLLLPLCLIFTQTAQAYSLARLPYKYQQSRSHQETLATDGMTIRANGTSDKTADRRLNNRAENQTQTSDLTQLASAGDITTRSGGDTRIEASIFNAQGGIDLNAGGSLTFAAVKDSASNQGRVRNKSTN